MNYSFNLKKENNNREINARIINSILYFIFFAALIFSLYQISSSVIKIVNLQNLVKKELKELKIPDKKEIKVFNKNAMELNSLIQKMDFSFSQVLNDLEETLITGIIINRIELSLHSYKGGPILPGGTIKGFSSNMDNAVEFTHKLTQSENFFDVVLKSVREDNNKTSYELVFHYEKN